MKIIHVCHLYLPHTGGIENYIHRLVNYCKIKGHKIKIVTNDASGSKKKEGEIFYGKTLLNAYRNPLSLQIYSFLKKEKADIYHLHSPWFFSSLLAMFALRKQPKIMTVHSAEITPSSLLSRLLYYLYIPIAIYILKKCDILIALSEIEKKKLIKKYKIQANKIHIIPNGIFIKPDLIFSLNDFLKKYNLRSDTKKILFISRLVPEKNAHQLIASLKFLDSQKVEVIIIGSKESSEYLKKLNSMKNKDVHIFQNLSDEDIYKFYQIASVFIFLGTWEGLPTVLLEALSHGLPIISTSAGGIPDLIKENENGFLINHPINCSDLAKKIDKILNHPEIAKKFAVQNKNKITNEFDFKIIAEKILNLYQLAINNYDIKK